MTRRGRAPRARLWLAGLLWAGLALGPLAAPAGAGTPAVGTPSVTAPGVTAPGVTAPGVTAPLDATLTLASVVPAVPRAGQDVRLTVTVANPGGQDLTGASVVVLLNGEDVDTRADVLAWATGEGTTSGARLLAEGQVPTVPAGERVDVSLTVAAGQIATQRSYAVLPLAVALRAGGEQVGALHTFLPWQRVKEYRPLTVAFAAPLTLDPDPALFGPVGDVGVAAWRAAIGPGSRLQRVVDATADAPVTWAVDPAIFGTDDPAAESVGGGGEGDPDGDDDQTPAGTPTVSASTPTGTATDTPTDTPTDTATATPTAPETEPTTEPTTEPKDGTTTPAQELSELVADLSERIGEVSGAHPVWRLPFSDPDLLAVQSSDPTTPLLPELVGRPTDLAARMGTTVTGGVFAWPVSGPITSAREAWLRAVFARDALTSALTWVSQLPSTNGYTGQAARRSAGGLPLLAADDELSRLFTAATGTGGAAATQQFLADSMALLGERSGTARTLLVTAPRSWSPDVAATGALFAAVASAPWLSVVDSGELIKDAVTAQPQSVPGDPGETTVAPVSVARSPLTADRVRGIPRTIDEVAGVSEILPAAAEFRSGWTQAQEQLLSTRWRGQPAAWRTVDTATDAAVSLVSGGVHVEPRAINFFADEGIIQITVVNTLDVEVHDVSLRLTVPGAEANRLRIQGQPDPLRIAANSRTTVRQQVVATASGRVTIVATLRSPNDTLLGSPAEVALRVQPTATWIFWVLGIVAGTILVLGLIRGLRRGRRRAGPPPAPPPGDEPSRLVP